MKNVSILSSFESSDFPEGLDFLKAFSEEETVLLNEMTPKEILFSAEIPLLFIVDGRDSCTLLAYRADETNHGSSFVLALCEPNTITDLRNGIKSVREALISEQMWFAYEYNDNGHTRTWKIDRTSSLEDFLPNPDVMLFSCLVK